MLHDFLFSQFSCRFGYKRYLIVPSPFEVFAKFVHDCPAGMNQRPREDEFIQILVKTLLEKGKTLFTQILAFMLDESDVIHFLCFLSFLTKVLSVKSFQRMAESTRSAGTRDVGCEQRCDQTLWRSAQDCAGRKSIAVSRSFVVVGSSVMFLTFYRGNNRLKVYPLGGQHVSKATEICAKRQPSNPDFMKHMAYVFFPMPKQILDKVLHNHCTI